MSRMVIVSLGLAAQAVAGGPEPAPATPASTLFGVTSVRSAAMVVRINRPALQTLQNSAGSTVVELMPLEPGLTIEVELRRIHVTNADTRFVLGRRDGPDQPLDFDPDSVTLLSGSSVDDPMSHVFLALTDSGGTGYVDYDGRRYTIASAPKAGGLLIAPAVATTGFVPPVPVCGVTEVHHTIDARGDTDDPGPWVGLKTLELAIETDYEYFELFGNLESAESYVIALYGAVGDIYRRDVDTPILLTFVRLWDTPDDLFNESDPLGPFVDYWNANMGDVVRDGAQLLTGRRDLPYGGVAYVSALCTSSAYSVAGFIIGSFDSTELPSPGNWDLMVTSHELGHNCGTLHTHDGYSPPIDQCGYGVVSRGTIMSYCHIVEGGISNIDPRIHSRVQEVIRDFVGGSACVVDDCNLNGVADALDLAAGTSQDLNSTGIPDECEDCNDNGILDDGDISGGTSADLNHNDIPDDCEPDCNLNLAPDDLDIEMGISLDLNGNNIPDECEPDCNDDGLADFVEINDDMALDIDRNAVLDDCQDCDDDGEPDAEALEGAHNLWVAGTGLNFVSEFHAASGVTVRTSEAGQVNNAQDLVVDSDHRVLVASASDDRVVEFDGATGAYVGDFVPAGSGGLDAPAALLVHADGHLLVASRNTDSVLEYDGDSGAFVGEFVTAGSGGLIQPMGLAVGPNGNLFVSSSSDEVLEYDGATGEFVRIFVTAGSGGLQGPRGLVFATHGNLLVASFDSDAVLEYDGGTGDFVRRFDNGGSPGGYWGLDRPRGLRVGPNGHVYVASNQGNAAIHMYDGESGAFLRSFYILSGGSVSNPTGFAFVPGEGTDCNFNLLPDNCDIASGVSMDLDSNGIPDECEGAVVCEGDANGDGVVDPLDSGFVLARFGCPVGTGDPSCDAADQNGDGVVDPLDNGFVLARFGECP